MFELGAERLLVCTRCTNLEMGSSGRDISYANDHVSYLVAAAQHAGGKSARLRSLAQVDNHRLRDRAANRTWTAPRLPICHQLVAAFRLALSAAQCKLLRFARDVDRGAQPRLIGLTRGVIDNIAFSCQCVFIHILVTIGDKRALILINFLVIPQQHVLGWTIVKATDHATILHDSLDEHTLLIGAALARYEAVVWPLGHEPGVSRLHIERRWH